MRATVNKNPVVAKRESEFVWSEEIGAPHHCDKTKGVGPRQPSGQVRFRVKHRTAHNDPRQRSPLPTGQSIPLARRAKPDLHRQHSADGP